MGIVEANKLVSFRPSEYDAKVLNEIHEKNPHLTNANDIIRHAIRMFDIEVNGEKSKSKRLERIEAAQIQILERLVKLENKVDRVVGSGSETK